MVVVVVAGGAGGQGGLGTEGRRGVAGGVAGEFTGWEGAVGEKMGVGRLAQGIEVLVWLSSSRCVSFRGVTYYLPTTRVLVRITRLANICAGTSNTSYS